MENHMENLLLIPVDDSVVFPNMTVTLAIDAGDAERVVLVPRKGDEFASVGTVANVVERVRLPGGGRAVALEGEYRARIGAASTDPTGALRVEVEPHPDDVPVDGRTRNLEREYRAVVAERLELALKLQRERLAELQVRTRIRDDVQSGAEKQQREYFLRKQMESIRKELGEDDASVVDEYRTKIEEAGMPEAVREQAERELGRLERMGEQGGEASMIRSYLDWLIAVPWGERSEERLDPVHTREVLDADHAGLEDVKDRIT